MAKKLKYANEDIVVGYAVKDDKGNKLSDAVIKANNSLQLPETAPTKTKLVGVGADKSQTFINIGDGFVLENNTLKASGGKCIMPNILINGDFKFNQRLMTAYYGPNTYGPDRWKVVDEFAGISSTNDNSWEVSLEDIKTAGERIVLSQKVENFKSLLDQDVTCHIEYKNLTEDVSGTTYMCVDDGVNVSSVALTSSCSATLTCHISANAKQVLFLLKTSATGKNLSVRVSYIKMEQSSQYTGKYHNFYADELVRCQRYFQAVQVLGCTNAPADATHLQIGAKLTNALRAKPTATILFGSRMPSVIGNSESIACNGVTVKKYNYNYVILEFTAKTNMTLQQLYSVGECNIALDAEIY